MKEPRGFFFQSGESELGSDREEILSRRGELGGKGAGLHALCAGGYRVPPGFTLSSTFCRDYFDKGRQPPDGLEAAVSLGLEKIEEAVGRKLGSGELPLELAVRSGAAVSMPGMMDTVLGVASRDELDLAVLKVFESWSSARAEAYRREQGILGLDGTAVTVQVLCPAEIAGVAFSRAPGRGGEDELLIEAVSGLGESLVSGEVTPDSYRLLRSSLELTGERSIGDKLLAEPALRELSGLCLRLEEDFGYPVDVEWAWAAGELWLLQVREIRKEAGRELRQEELERARGLLGDDGLLVRHNLDETLSNPTPMTWDIQSEFMSGRGGFGALYRRLGYFPSARADSEGFLELVGGRIFADPARCAELFYSRGVLSYDSVELEGRPAAIEEPPRLWKTREASPPALLRTLLEVVRSSRQAQRGRHQALDEFLTDELPRYEAWVARERQVELEKLGPTELYDILEMRIRRVMGDFAPKVLKLSFYANLALDEFNDLLERCLGFERGAVQARALLGALDGDLAVEQALWLIEAGKPGSGLQDFLDRFGHRCGREMELAEKRWWEEPGKVRLLGQQMALTEADFRARRLSFSEQRVAVELDVLERLGREQPEAVEPFAQLLRETRRLLPWRENGKFHWMAGYDLIRRALVELDKRLSLEGNVFYLERAELRECLDRGEQVLPDRTRESISHRRRCRRGFQGLDIPGVLSASTLAAGPGEGQVRRDDEASGGILHGEGISSGTGKGKIWVCSSAADKPPFEGPYLLVAESTDPDWTPLLAAAAGLVVERGGSLSHGAIVCRDFGIPAVVIEAAGRKLHTGVEAVLDADHGELRLAAGDGGQPAGQEEDPASRDWDPGPEPYCAPPAPGTGRRAILGLLGAVLLSLLLVSVDALSSRLADLAGLVLDRWSLGGATPFASIFAAALLGALLSLGILALSSDRKGLRRARQRLRWYRKNAARAKAEEQGDILRKIRRRMVEAKSDRALTLLKPIAWTFLPLCLGFIWVNDRFAAEPISPGSRFRVTAFVEPGAGRQAERLRFARMDTTGGLQVLGTPYRMIEPNSAAPALSAYKVAWDVEALREGTHELSVAAAGEKVKKSIIVTTGIERAKAIGRYGGGIPELQVDHRALVVHLPGWFHSIVSRIAAFFSGGRGLIPAQTAVGPWTAYLALAVMLVLALQWLSGYR